MAKLRQNISRRSAWLVGGACALLGLAALVGAHADTITTTIEAEAGTLAGRIGINSDPAASGGGFVTFGQPLSYVALGDSVASGDGIEYGWKWTPDGAGDGSWTQTGPAAPVWEPAADTRPEVQACHRSAKAYPYLVAAKSGNKLYNPSCSGSSVLDGVLGSRNFSASVIGAAQVGSAKTVMGYAPPNPDYDAARPDVVSITLGMDDVAFSGVLRSCYLGTSCVTPAADADINQKLATFKTNLELLLAEIKDRGTAAKKVPAVVLTTYYDPFNPDSNKRCHDTYIGLGNGLDANEIDWMRSKLQMMNQYITEAAATYPKSVTVDISKVLEGHEFCSGNPWVYGISIWYHDFGNPAPFHPTPEGQQAIADKVAAAMANL